MFYLDFSMIQYCFSLKHFISLNIDDGVKHNNSIDNVHEEEVKESESEHRFYYKLSTFKIIIQNKSKLWM